jgi:hypothetical protein
MTPISSKLEDAVTGQQTLLNFSGTLVQVDRESRATRFSIHQGGGLVEVSTQCPQESGSSESSDSHHISNAFPLEYSLQSPSAPRKAPRTEPS